VNITADATVISVTPDPNNNATVTGTPIVVTLLAGQGGSQELTEALSSQLQMTAESRGITVTMAIRRFGKSSFATSYFRGMIVLSFRWLCGRNNFYPSKVSGWSHY